MSAELSNTLRAASLVVLIPAGFALGGERGAVMAVAASQFAGWPLALAFKHRNGLLSWRGEALWPFALMSGLAAGWLIDALLTLLLNP